MQQHLSNERMVHKQEEKQVRHDGKICNASSRLMLRLADGLGRWADRGGCEGSMHINVCSMVEVDDFASSSNQASNEFKHASARDESFLAIEMLSESKSKAHSNFGCFKLRKPRISHNKFR